MRAVIISERLIVNVKIVFVRGFINKIIYIQYTNKQGEKPCLFLFLGGGNLEKNIKGTFNSTFKGTIKSTINYKINFYQALTICYFFANIRKKVFTT